MKKYLLVFSMLVSMLSVVNISQANANCSPDDPCGTWALLDNQGVVTNVIVCQASVCGGGVFGSQTVVPQVAPNPVTNDTSGTPAYNSSPNQEVRYTGGGTFVVDDGNNPISFSYDQTVGNSNGFDPYILNAPVPEPVIISTQSPVVISVQSMGAAVQEFTQLSVAELPQAFLKANFTDETVKKEFVNKVLAKKIKEYNLKIKKKLKQLSNLKYT
jgi:hypothetical protein